MARCYLRAQLQKVLLVLLWIEPFISGWKLKKNTLSRNLSMAGERGTEMPVLVAGTENWSIAV